MSRNVVAAFAVIAVAGFAGCAAMARAELPRTALPANPSAGFAPGFAAPPPSLPPSRPQAPEVVEDPLASAPQDLRDDQGLPQDQVFAAAETAIAPFQTWTQADAAYRFFPGDEIEVAVRSAPELSRTIRIAPDGRITLPLIAPVMAADRTAEEITTSVETAYRAVLRDPSVDIIARGFGSQQVFVAGEVRTPGALDLNAPIDAFQAVTRAGGFLTSARADHVYILRRDPGGAARVYRADLSGDAFRNGLVQLGPLQRYDVVYVPRSPISEIGLFMQQYVRDALPVNFSLFYDLRGENRR